MSLRSHKLMSEINVVPYIDVMLVLLIIFMVTVPLIQQGVEIELPQAPAKTLDSGEVPDPLIVTVNDKGVLFVNKGIFANRSISEKQLVGEIKKWLPVTEGKVYVRGDSSANYGDVVAAMVVLQNAGATDIGLITQPAENLTGHANL